MSFCCFLIASGSAKANNGSGAGPALTYGLFVELTSYRELSEAKRFTRPAQPVFIIKISESARDFKMGTLEIIVTIVAFVPPG